MDDFSHELPRISRHSLLDDHTLGGRVDSALSTIPYHKTQLKTYVELLTDVPACYVTFLSIGSAGATYGKTGVFYLYA